MEALKNWMVNLLISIDQLGNSILGGDPDETISSRIGRYKKANGGQISWSHPVTKLVDAALNVIDENHCIDAIECCIEKRKEGKCKNATQ